MTFNSKYHKGVSLEVLPYETPTFPESKFRIDLMNEKTGLCFIFNKEDLEEFKKFVNSIKF